MALTDSLRILITANGAQATREFDRVGKAANQQLGKAESSTKKFGRNLVSAGAGIAAFAGIAFVGLQKAAQAADEENRAILRLQNSISNSPALVGASTDAFLEQAAALQDTTKFADDATISAQAMLGTFRLSQDQILQLTPLVADLASKFDVDMDRAAVNVGKAMQGSASALQRWGVIIDEDAFATDRFGAILSALRENAGGFAEQEGKTFSGQLAIMQNNLGDVVEEIGKSVTPALVGFVDAIGEATPILADLAPLLNDTAASAGDLAENTAGAVGFFAGVADGARSLNLGPAPDIAEWAFGNLNPVTASTHVREFFGEAIEGGLSGDIGDKITGVFSDGILSSAAVVEALGSVAIASASAAAGIETEGEAATEAAAAIDQLTERQDAYIERALGLGDARDELASSFNSLYESLLTGSRAFRGNGQAAIENRAALDQIVVGTSAVIQQQVQHGASERRLQATKRQSIARIRETATAFGIERGAVQGAINTIRDIPTSRQTDLRLNASADVGPAMSALEELRAKVAVVAEAYLRISAAAASAAAVAPAPPSGGGGSSGGGRSRSAAAPEASMEGAFRRAIRDEVMTVQVVG